MQPNMRVPIGFFGIRDFPYLKPGIREMVARLGIESMHGMPEIALGISGLSENSDRDDGIKTNSRALRKRCGGNRCLPVLACVAGFEMGRG